MDVWQEIKILRETQKTSIFSKDNIAAKQAALNKIANEGHPALIIYLIGFLKDDTQQIRELTCETIIRLFKKISSKKGYYDALKNCHILKSDINFYERNFSTAQYVDLLTICSLNRDGYLREETVNRLTQLKNPVAIQFLIYRLADWVKPVQQAALKGIEQYTSLAYIDTLIENLPLLEWLQKVQRTDLGVPYRKIISFIASANRDYIISRFRKYPDKIRFLLATHMAASLTEPPKELGLLLSDKSASVRNLALNHFDKLTEHDIAQLLSDRSPKIRLQMLYIFKNQNDFEHMAKKYLADNSGTIRYFARFHLQKSNINFADFYNQQLLENNQVTGALNGLAEVGAKQYVETIKKFLYHKKVKTRKTAFLALWILDEENAFEYALENLGSPFAILRNICIELLARSYTPQVLMKAREVYAHNDLELKKSMLKLFAKISGLTTIPDLMLGTIDENETIRQLAFDYIQTWKIRARRFFRTPRPGEIDKAKQTFALVYQAHEARHYFNKNPLNGIDFYFS